MDVTVEQDQEALLDLLLTAGVLRFGRFTTKSGRLSPFFFNFGAIDRGDVLRKLGDIYARSIVRSFGDGVGNLFGPAYKGISLAVMTSDCLGSLLGRSVTFTFNRKEAKDHGEGGNLVGHAYRGGENVVIVEDVITGGTSLRETIPLLKHAGVRIVGALVGIDRQEIGGTAKTSASAEVETTYGVPVRSVLNISQIVGALHNVPRSGRVWINDETRRAIDIYLDRYALVQ